MSMSMNVKDYMKIYDGFLEESFCKTIVGQLKEANWQTHTFYQAKDNNYVSLIKNFLFRMYKHQKQQNFKTRYGLLLNNIL